jgi:hypothetical protein
VFRVAVSSGAIGKKREPISTPPLMQVLALVDKDLKEN